MTQMNYTNIRSSDPLNDAMINLFANASAEYSYGLDFGTYRSMMAYKSSVMPDPGAVSYESPAIRDGIPSLFWYSAATGREYVCEEVIANNGLFEDPQGICSSVKMKLDSPYVTLGGKRFLTADIAEKEIRRILSLSHKAMERTLFDVPRYNKLVAGVPVRFGSAKRQALLDILKQATDGKEIVLLPEPIAAALMYSHYTRKKLGNILVFDLGAGTFDTVLLVPNLHRTKENPYEFRALYPDGLEIAGDYFDSMMAELIIETLRAGRSTLDTGRLASPRTADHQKLMAAARDIKEKLSTAEFCSSYIQGVDSAGRPDIQQVVVYREDFERKIRPALAKAVDCAYNVLVRAGAAENPNIDILLVGGSTYIPLVRTMVEEKFPHIRRERILQRMPEQAVALGCALYAGRPNTDTPTAYAYAVRTLNGPHDEPKLKVKIPSNARLPYKISSHFYTRWKDQTAARFLFYEVENGEEDSLLNIDEGNPTSLSISHAFGRPVPAHTRMLLTIELDRNGTLTVTIDDEGITPVETHRVRISDLHCD